MGSRMQPGIFSPDQTSVLLAGVGGQGILLASAIIARAAILAGFDVKTNEVHGMAQRGGSVVAEIRFGKKIYSPLIPPLGAQVLAAFEAMEALRYAGFLSSGGHALISTLRIIPTSVSSGFAAYPQDLDAVLRRTFRNVKFVDAAAAARKAGSPKAINMAILGAVSSVLAFDDSIWQKAIGLCVKAKFVEANLQAFAFGKKLAA